MNETKKPAIRFQGFSDEWKQSRVGELIEDYTEKTVVQNQYPVLTSSQQQGIVRQEEYFADRQVTTNDNVGYFVLPFGYFTYRSRSDTDVFVFNRNDLINKGIISCYYPVFAPKSCDSNFLLRRLNYGIKKQLSMAAEGTGQKVLAHNKFKDMIVDVPDEKEQIKIGAIFECVDNLIAQHESKLEKLQAVKASMLEKMFPKDGAAVPEIRFKGFTGAWERHKLTDFVEFFSGLTYTPADVQETGTFVLRSSNVNNGEVVNADNVYVRTEVINVENVKKGDIIVVVRNGSRSLIGKHAQIKRFMPNTVIGAFMTGIRSVCPDFTNALLNTIHFDDQIAMNMGATINQITGYMFSKMEFKIPSLSEQIKIGEYFLELDQLISLQRQQLDKLQSIKKALLEKMFV